MAENLKRFDERVPELLQALTANDLLIVTAPRTPILSGNLAHFPGSCHHRQITPLWRCSQRYQPVGQGGRWSSPVVPHSGITCSTVASLSGATVSSAAAAAVSWIMERR